jgi:tetratricopeptide (TPR) repeat protein
MDDRGVLASGLIELYLLEWTRSADTRLALKGCREAVDLAREVGATGIETQGLERLAKHLIEMDERSEARVVLDQALARLSPDDGSSRRGKILIRKSLLAKMEGDSKQALDLLAQALREAQRTGSRWVEGMAEMRFGEIRAEQGQYEQSLRAYERSYRTFREAGSASAWIVRIAIGITLIYQENWRQARDQLAEVLTFSIEKNRAFMFEDLCSAILAPAAHTGDWVLWDLAIAQLSQDLGRRPDPDHPKMLQLGAEAATLMGDADRAADAWRMAIVRFQSLGWNEEVRVGNAALNELGYT